MRHKLENLYAYRFYEKKDGPLVTIRQFGYEEVSQIGSVAGITNIHDIYKNREIIEDLLYRMFVRQGGQPKLTFPYYAAVFDELPKSCQLHVRFNEPECLKIPMYAFPKEHVSFTYGQSPRALTRKDSHPTRRKLLTWDNAEWAINQFPFDEDEGTWLEMQIWEEDVIRQYYHNGNGENITAFEVKDRLDAAMREDLLKKYMALSELIKPEYFFMPSSAHGVSHAMRVLVLSQELAMMNQLTEHNRKILVYCAAFHDIGRNNHLIDNNHGQRSFQKIEELKLIPESFDSAAREVLRFIVENHPLDLSVAKENFHRYRIIDKEGVFAAYCIFKDADTLDRCRFGHIDPSYMCDKASKNLVNFAYQLLTIFREAI